jgi:hypothetical protein
MFALWQSSPKRTAGLEQRERWCEMVAESTEVARAPAARPTRNGKRAPKPIDKRAQLAGAARHIQHHRRWRLQRLQGVADAVPLAFGDDPSR